MSDTVLVTGSENTGGLAVLRGLDAAGYRAWAAVSSDESFGAASRAAAGVVRTADPQVDPKGFVLDLAEAAKRVGASVVLPGTEQALLAVSEHAAAFPPHIAVGAPDLRSVLAATDKTTLPELAAAAGFRVPPTQLMGADTGIDTAGVEFPVMVKPLRSVQNTADGLRRFEVSRVDTPVELAAALAALPDGQGLVQPFLAGRIRTVNGVAWNGEVVITVHKLAHRTWPIGGGVVCSATTTAVHPALEAASRTLIRNVNWSGLFNLQLIETPDGRHHLIDVNPRMYHSLALAIGAGANLPAIWTDLLLNREPVLGPYRSGVHFRAQEDFYNLALTLVRRPGSAPATLAALLPRRHTVHPVFRCTDLGPVRVRLRGVGRKVRGAAARRARGDRSCGVSAAGDH